MVECQRSGRKSTLGLFLGAPFLLKPFAAGVLLTNVEKAESYPISISKKCCWCCWELYQYLGQVCQEQKYRPDKGTIPPPNLELLNSHSTIYPWYPPPCVPYPLLRSLRTKLENQLVETLREEICPVEDEYVEEYYDF